MVIVEAGVFPSFAKEGWTRPKENAAKHPLWSGRGGRSQKRGRNASRAIVGERPPRRFAPPLLYQEGSSRSNGFRNLDSCAFAKEGVRVSQSVFRRGGRK